MGVSDENRSVTLAIHAFDYLTSGCPHYDVRFEFHEIANCTS